MKHKTIKIHTVPVFFAVLFLLTVVFSTKTMAMPYLSYEYNSNDKSLAAPDGYILDSVIDSDFLQLETPLSKLSDVKILSDGTVWLLDSGNSRIIVTDINWKIIKTIEGIFDSGTSETIDFTNACGLTVTDDGTLYIADTENHRILVADSDGKLRFIINKPETSLIDEKALCNFTKVLVDDYGRIYAIADDVNTGAMVFTNDGEFKTFYGSNPVVKTFDVIKKYFTRRFMSEVQLKGSKQFTSVNFSNFDITSDGFIYTVTKDENNLSVTSGMVRKLNVLGNNIMSGEEEMLFGDLEYNTDFDSPGGTKLTDIEVDSDGFIFLLDSTRGRVFLYSQEDGIMMTAFGGLGEQKGLFVSPMALETYGDTVYVLDSEEACVYAFKPTEYMLTFREGIIKLEKGDFDGAYALFERIIAYNTNNETAYKGMGKALDEQGKYKEAMEYFKKAYDRNGYSEAFEEYRKIFIREHFMPIVLGILVLFTAIIFVSSKIRKKLALAEGEAYSGWETKRLLPFYTMRHPIDGFAQFRVRNIMSWTISLIIIAVWFVIEVADYFLTGFALNENRPENYRLIYTVLQTIGAFLLFVISNYAICTLLEGKGKFKEIFAGTAYSLLPMLICKVIALGMSQVMTVDEGAFVEIVLWVGILWSAFLVFSALSTIHQYSFKKTIASILLTIFGMAVILFIIILFYSLLLQVFEFLSSINREISLR